MSNYVFWEPEIPVPGGEITIYYNTIDGSLPNSTFPVYVHLGNDGWQDVEDYAMSYSPINGVGWWKYSHQIVPSGVGLKCSAILPKVAVAQ